MYFRYSPIDYDHPLTLRIPLEGPAESSKSVKAHLRQSQLQHLEADVFAFASSPKPHPPPVKIIWQWVKTLAPFVNIKIDGIYGCE